MHNPLHNIRRGERRDTWAAFFTLFGILTGHAILETARDALFLASIPAEQLPWVYLGIAALSLLVVRMQLRLGRRRRRRMLALSLALSALVTALFWALLEAMGNAGLYALYIWSGVLSTLVLVHFWTLLADLFSVSQAKRVFGLIGTGSVLGAIFGSAIAGALALETAPKHLLLASAGVLLLTSLLPPLLSARRSPALPEGSDRDSAFKTLIADFGFILQRVYARRVVALLALTAATVTVADYLFKHLLREEVPPDQLDQYLAAFYLAANVLSLLVQLFVVNWITRRFTVLISLGVLPVLLLLGGVGIAVIGGLTMAMWVKGADSSLRHSLNKTSTELLFFPMGEVVRNRAKAFIDVVGQRGGQALASVGILIAAALGLSNTALGITLAVLAALWLVGVLRLREPYLELFRKQLRKGHLAHHNYPELDLASAETLVAGLDSEEDDAVIAAISLLARTERLTLVPTLILYHPSEAVVIHALTLFRRAHRVSALRVAGRIMNHPSSAVRAALVGFTTALRPDADVLRSRLAGEEDVAVRAAIMVHLIALGQITGTEADETLDALLASGPVDARIRLAEALEISRAPGFGSCLAALADDPDLGVRLAAARAMGEIRDPAMLPALLRLTGHDASRSVAADAIVSFGTPAVRWLCDSLADTATPPDLRWQIPRLLAVLAPEQQANPLLGLAPGEQDGMVRYHIIRALQDIKRTHPKVALDPAMLDIVIHNALGRAYRSVARRLLLDEGAAADPRRRTAGHQLLRRVLDGKLQSALGRLFRTLSLRYPYAEFDAIERGLRRGDREQIASSIELLENLLKPPLRTAVVGLVDDIDDAERFAYAGPYFERRAHDYEELVATLITNRSQSLTAIAIFHAGELRMTQFRDTIAALDLPPDLTPDRDRTLALLDAA